MTRLTRYRCFRSVSNTSSISSTALTDTMPDLSSLPPIFFHDDLDSTMDAAKEKISEAGQEMFAVVTRRQHRGRGTRGRSWESAEGNLFMTVAIPTRSIPIPLQLCPLRIGTLVLPSIQSRVSSTASLKWPNDVLIEEEKVCGVLTEVENNYLFAGIGCNIVVSPSIPDVGPNAGRPATCAVISVTVLSITPLGIAHHLSSSYDSSSLSTMYRDISEDVFRRIRSWVENGDSAEAVVADFQSQMLLNPQRMRPSSGGDGEGEAVLPLKLNSDGTLQVRLACVSCTSLRKCLIGQNSFYRRRESVDC